MNQKEVEKKLHDELNLPTADVSALLKETAKSIAATLKDEDAVLIQRIGSFEVKKKLERITVHPGSGRRILVPPKLTINFQPSKLLKEKIKESVTNE